MALTNYSFNLSPMEVEHTVNISLIVTDETQPEIDEHFLVSVLFPEDLIQRVTLEPEDATVAIFEVNGQSMIVYI